MFRSVEQVDTKSDRSPAVVSDDRGDGGGVSVVRSALSIVPLSSQFSRDNTRRASPTTSPAQLDASKDKWADVTLGKRRATTHSPPLTQSPAHTTSAALAPTDSVKRVRSNTSTDSDCTRQHSPSIAAASSTSPALSLLCSEELPPELVSSTISQFDPAKLSASAVCSMAADYARLVDRCYALSCLHIQQQIHDSRHTPQPPSVSTESECGSGGFVPLSVYWSDVSGVLSDVVAAERLGSCHRQLWFDLLERRVAQRDERIVQVESERAVEREQWREKQRALEHEVSRLRVELQLHNAASSQAVRDGYMAVPNQSP